MTVPNYQRADLVCDALSCTFKYKNCFEAQLLHEFLLVKCYSVNIKCPLLIALCSYYVHYLALSQVFIEYKVHRYYRQLVLTLTKNFKYLKINHNSVNDDIGYNSNACIVVNENTTM